MTLPDGYNKSGTDLSGGKKKIGKGKKIAIGVGIVFVGFIILVAVVAATSPNTTPQQDQNNPPSVQQPQTNPPSSLGINPDSVVGISEFGMSKQGSLYQAHFQLTDAELHPIAIDAKVAVVVTVTNTQSGNDGKIVYSKSFDVRASDFKDYTRAFTGAETGNQYLWLIDGNELSGIHQDSSSFGKATLKVTLSNGKSFSADSTIL